MSPIVPLLLACSTRQPPEPAPPAGYERLQAERLKAHVAHLADDSFNGRDTPSPGLDRAGRYLATQLAQCGLQPLPGDDDFFAEYTLYRTGYDAQKTTLRVNGADAALGADWRPFNFSDPGAISGDIVFAGYGITAPELGHDDYEGLDVEGKIVLILRHEPGEDDPDSPFDGTSSTDHATFLRKAVNAAEHGAVGYLLVTDPLHHPDSDDLRAQGQLRLSPPEPDDGSSAPQGAPFRAAHISRALAERIVASSGKSLTELQQALEGGTLPRDLPIKDASAALALDFTDGAEEIPVRNVAAYLPGASRPDEEVIIGAHYDHVGGYTGEGDTIFNGADDNASGTAGMLELACAFATRPEPPARSMVFLGFSAEEKGLLGARAWTEAHGTEDTVFMLNLDMIGRNPDEPVALVGDGYSTETSTLAEAAIAQTSLDAVLGGTSYSGNSDHAPFYEADVPFLFFFTGTHEDYHQPGDHADKLAYDRMLQIVQSGWHLVAPIADAKVTPAFIHHVGWLGVSIGPGGQIDTVVAPSRASAAGFAADDTVREINSAPVDDATIGAALRGIEPGTAATFTIDRAGETLALSVQRAKTGYLGIYPAPPTEEQSETLGLVNDAGVRVRQLAADGPAAQSGLKADDVILEIAGQPVSVDTLGMVLQRIGAGEAVDCLVARDGERITIDLVLGERPER